MSFTVIAYRKLCGADRQAADSGALLPRRFELHTTLNESEARTLFGLYQVSPQVLAVELYGPLGLLDRSDLLVNLYKTKAAAYDFARATHSH